MPVDREERIVAQTVLMLQERMSETAAAMGSPIVILPEIIGGYSSTVLAEARNDANSIRIWVDSVTPVQEYMNNWVDEMINVGILRTYSSLKPDFGAVGRVNGELIRRTIREWWKPYYSDGAIDVKVTMDYRFASERMTGGSRRGLIGTLKDVGHNKESFSMGVCVLHRSRDNIRHTCL
jgi:hypothetical protein